MATAIGKLQQKKLEEEVEVCWEIPNFFSLKNDIFRSASNFEFLGNKWCLLLDPFEFHLQDELDDDNEISLHLEMLDVKLSCNIMFTFGIRKANGSLFGVQSFKFTFSEKEDVFIASEFLPRETLRGHASELLPSNILTIVCTLKYLPGSLKLRGQDLLSKNIKSFFNNKELCDVTLQLHDTEFLAHRFILSARSPVFAAMFKHETSEKETGIVKIPDCDPESFRVFLDYLYSGTLDGISLCNAPHLYKTADKYDIQELKMFCIEYMRENVKVENFFHIVILADEYDEAELFKDAQYFFNRNLKEIFDSDEWEDFSTEHVTLAKKLLREMALKIKVVE